MLAEERKWGRQLRQYEELIVDLSDELRAAYAMLAEGIAAASRVDRDVWSAKAGAMERRHRDEVAPEVNKTLEGIDRRWGGEGR